jgi:hypothetical protein
VTPALVDGYREHGVDRLVALCFAFDRDSLVKTLDQLAADLLVS